MVSQTILLWRGFNVLVLAMLALDLGVFHRKAHTTSIKEAVTWSVVWISLAILFNAGIYFFSGPEPAVQFFTGYLIEKSLSVDNIFVFVFLFTSFSVPVAHQHRVLFCGVLGDLVIRGIMIAVVLTITIVASIIHARRREARNREPEPEVSEVLAWKLCPADEEHFMKKYLSKGIKYANAPNT